MTNNQTFTEPHEVTGPGVIETNEFTLYGTGASVIRVAEKGDLELRGNVSSSKGLRLLRPAERAGPGVLRGARVAFIDRDMGFTVTVTVTGKAYNGTFTKDYEFTKDELERPVLEWNIVIGQNLQAVPIHRNGSFIPAEAADSRAVLSEGLRREGAALHRQVFWKKSRHSDSGRRFCRSARPRLCLL